MLASLKLKFKLSLVYWLNSTQFKIESKISFLRKILRNILRFGKFFCYELPNHVQIYDLGHFLGKIITLLNLCLVLLLEQSIVACTYLLKIKTCCMFFYILYLYSIEHLKIGFFFLMCNRNPIREPSEYMFSLKILHNFILYKKKFTNYFHIFNNSDK